MKLRHITDLQSYLDKEFAWRIREINYVKDRARLAADAYHQTAVRAGLPLVYAHWEGFTKRAAEALLNFVGCQRHSYEELKPCFIAHGLGAHLETLTTSHKHSKRAAAVEFIQGEMKSRARVPWKGVVSTQANLSSAVFSEIAAALGISTDSYESRYNFIDKSLLSRRNIIAHGERLDLDVSGLRDVAEETIRLLRQFKTDIENLVSERGYLR